MAQLDGSITLITDLDDTLLPSNKALRQRQAKLREAFRHFVEKWRGLGKLRLIIVTRARILRAQWSHFASNDLPDPDFLISYDIFWGAPLSVLARPGVHFASDLLPEYCLSSGAQHIAEGILINNYHSFLFPERYMLGQWLRNADLPVIAVEHSVTASGGLGLVLRFIPGTDHQRQDTQRKLQHQLWNIYGVFAEIETISGDQAVVRFPTSKGAFLRVLARALSLSEATIIAAGDRTDDLDMIAPSEHQSYSVHTGIAVANARQDLLAAVRAKPSEHLYISTKGYLLGVLQGMLKSLQQLVTPQQPPSE